MKKIDGAMTKVLIEYGMRVRKLQRLARVGGAGTTGMGAIGIVGPTVTLDSSGISVTMW